jgi:thiol-disulfide isomerase/thioredoxin
MKSILGILLLATGLVMLPVQARELSIYQGDPAPPPLQLKDLGGKLRDLGDYKGKVVLLNYWATWCPPCREEMPSMWRLQNEFRGQPFRIIAVNMAETDAEVNTFLPDRMKRDFVVLMDRDGEALKRWKVFAFPTSFVLDKQGRIRYGLFGATEWDSWDNKQVIRKLLAE